VGGKDGWEGGVWKGVRAWKRGGKVGKERRDGAKGGGREFGVLVQMISAGFCFIVQQLTELKGRTETNHQKHLKKKPGGKPDIRGKKKGTYVVRPLK